MGKGDGHRFSLHDKKPVHAILFIFKQVKHQYDLQYFSYHYHHYNDHYISKFWQVRNLFISVCLSVCLSVTPFWPCSHHHIIMKFSGGITNDRSDVHAKGQGQRSKVKVKEVKKIVKFYPDWAFPDCNSSFNSPMTTKWCTKLEVA